MFKSLYTLIFIFSLTLPSFSQVGSYVTGTFQSGQAGVQTVNVVFTPIGTPYYLGPVIGSVPVSFVATNGYLSPTFLYTGNYSMSWSPQYDAEIIGVPATGLTNNVGVLTTNFITLYTNIAIINTPTVYSSDGSVTVATNINGTLVTAYNLHTSSGGGGGGNSNFVNVSGGIQTQITSGSTGTTNALSLIPSVTNVANFFTNTQEGWVSVCSPAFGKGGIPAYPNAVSLNGVTIATGGSNVTATGSPFGNTNLGQVITIWGAGTNGTNSLTSIITNVISSSQVQISNIAPTGITNTIGGMGTDDTYAITNANWFLATNGYYHKLVWPPGGYVFNGTPQDPGDFTSHHNAMMFWPDFSSIPITTPTYTWETLTGPNVGQTFNNTNHSDLAGTMIWVTAPDGYGARFMDCQNFTTPLAVSGTEYLVWENNMRFENHGVGLRLPPNSTLRGYDLAGSGSAKVTDLTIDHGQSWLQCAIGPSTNNIGLIMPTLFNNSMNYMENVQIIGCWSGMIPGEHLLALNAQIFNCTNGILLLNSDEHASEFIHCLLQECATNIWAPVVQMQVIEGDFNIEVGLGIGSSRYTNSPIVNADNGSVTGEITYRCANFVQDLPVVNGGGKVGELPYFTIHHSAAGQQFFVPHYQGTAYAGNLYAFSNLTVVGLNSGYQVLFPNAIFQAAAPQLTLSGNTGDTYLRFTDYFGSFSNYFFRSDTWPGDGFGVQDARFNLIIQTNGGQQVIMQYTPSSYAGGTAPGIWNWVGQNMSNLLLQANSITNSGNTTNGGSVITFGTTSANFGIFTNGESTLATNYFTENSYSYANPTLGTSLTNGWTNNTGTNAWFFFTSTTGSTSNVIYTAAGQSLVTNLTPTGQGFAKLNTGMSIQLGVPAGSPQPKNIYIQQ